MLVEATKTGFIYGKLRNEGDQFTLKPLDRTDPKKQNDKPVSVQEQFSESWMRSLEPKKKVKAKSLTVEI